MTTSTGRPTHTSAHTQSHDPWYVRAERDRGFPALVGVELRKLTGTRSDKVLVGLAPLLIIGITALFVLLTEDLPSATDQIGPLVFGMGFSQILVLAAVIKLVSGEWHYRSVQSSLLVQPSRLRHLAAQGCVGLLVTLGAVVVQISSYLVAIDVAIDAANVDDLVTQRVGWVIGVALVGSLLLMLTALVLGLLIPNPTGVLIALFLATVVFALVRATPVAEYFSWIDPYAGALIYSGVLREVSVFPAVTSLLVWCGLLVVGVRVVISREAA